MHLEGRRWLPARLVWRWGALLWIGPLLGLVVGLVLVFGFLKENETMTAEFDTGYLPGGLDREPYLAALRSELESESFMVEVQSRLDRDRPLIKTPLWWLRPRVQLEVVRASWFSVRFTHHSWSGRQRLFESFEAVARERVPRVRARFVEGWREKIDERLVEIEVVKPAAEAMRKIPGRAEIPFLYEYEQLEGDRLALSMKQPLPGQGFVGWNPPGGYSPWWKSPPTWAVLIGMCAGYGLMAVFPAMIIFELMWPRRHAPEIDR